MENENVLNNMVRVGVVSAIDTASHRARVIFPDKGITSGWLFVLKSSDSNPRWMPALGNTVVVLYLPIWNGDGFILGVV
jgi:phage baseplate assembly protein gpV